VQLKTKEEEKKKAKERKEAKDEGKAKKKQNHAIPIYYRAYDTGNCAINIRCVVF
jgi:hypothetical protein